MIASSALCEILMLQCPMGTVASRNRGVHKQEGLRSQPSGKTSERSSL